MRPGNSPEIRRNPGVELGLGLIGLGKPWGHRPVEVPSRKEALEFLSFAWSSGIRYFDTAPSYGISEEQLGAFLETLTPAELQSATIATKFGEHWDAGRAEPYVDHSFDALKASLDGSLRRLGRIDILQLHKTSVPVLRSKHLAMAWDYARSLGIPVLGASCADLSSASLVYSNSLYGVLQIPCNQEHQIFVPMFEAATRRGLRLAINRPFAMGKIFYQDAAPADSAGLCRDAFRFLLSHPFNGVVLSGTRSRAHLEENCRAWQAATA